MLTTHTLNRDQIVEAVLRKLSVLSEGQTPSAKEVTDTQEAINNTLAQFKSLGMPLWARTEYTFTPVSSLLAIGKGKTLDTPYPVQMLQAVRNENGARIEMQLVPKEEFNTLPPASSGVPIKMCYTPYIESGIINLWPSPASGTYSITVVYLRQLQYFNLATDALDMPSEWIDALIYAVAVKLSPEWSIPLQDRQFLKAEAKEYLENAQSVGQDVGSFYIRPAREQ